MSANNTINLDDSSVLSSTKNSSVLEVTTDVVDIVTDSSDTEGEDEVNSTSENVDSSSDRLIRENSKEMSRAEVMSEDEMGDQSSVYSATLLMSNLSSNQVSSSLLTVFSLTTPRLPRTSQVS